MNKNKKLLDSFTKHCEENPSERFWQALRNWSDYNFIYGSDDLIKVGMLEDTFYKENV